MPPAPSPTERFSDRVASYVRYRPGYPPGLLGLLRDQTGLTPRWTIADIGSGTGISTELFLKHGNTVYAIEPNDAMRAAAVQQLAARYPNLRSVKGTAEATNLPSASVDLAAAFQAFHWFDLERAPAEFARLLRPPGWVALVFNRRKTAGSTFLEGYEAIIKHYSADYHAVRHERVGDPELRRIFAGAYASHSLPNQQLFDFDGLRGRVLSSSYAPNQGQPGHEQMMADLRCLFDRTAENGRVAFDYETQIYVGTVNRS
jgi:SAM-dependent methyltransferase